MIDEIAPLNDDNTSPAGGWRFSRKALLVGAGLGTVGTQLIRSGRSATAEPAGHPSAVGEPADPILTGARFPIGLFWPPPPFQTNLERYREIADAGFTFVISGNYLNDRYIIDHALSFCDRTGLDMLVADPDVGTMIKNFTIGGNGDQHLSEAELQQIIRGAIDHYAPGGWQIVDDALRIRGGSGDGSIGLTKDGSSWTDYTLAFNLTLADTTSTVGYSQGGWVVRSSDTGSGYVWLVSDHKTGEPDAPGFLTKAVFDAGSLISVDVKPLTISIEPGTTYAVSTEVSGSTISTSIDGSVIDTTTDSRFVRGRVGFRQAGQESAVFDAVRVTDGSGKSLFSEDFEGDLAAWETPAASGHPSFAGLVLYDEPSGAKVADVAAATRLMQDLDQPFLPYTNLLPGLGDQYLEQGRTIGTPLLSFDRYPLLTDGVDAGYFANWADVGSAAAELQVPSWTFIQSVGYNAHSVPSAAGMLWQINISLAYGCKGIQFFTYWTPDPARGEGFHNALITPDGRRTARYDGARKINNDYLQPVGNQLLPLHHESVFAVSLDKPPAGLPALADDKLVAGAVGDPAVVARFSEDDHDYLLVANYSATTTARVQLRWQPTVDTVEEFEPDTERYRRGSRDTRYRLPPGAATLLRIG